MGVSLKPSDAIQGGGNLDNVDVTIAGMRFRTWDYNGTIPAPVLGLEVDFEFDDGTKAQQVYSAGDLKHFVPSDDGGRSAIPVGKLTGLVESTNAMAFLTSLVSVGFPEDKIGDTVDGFVGTKIHLDAVPQPKRGGAAAGGANKTIALATKLIALPGEKTGKAAPKGTKPVAAKSAAKPVAAQETAAQGTGDGGDDLHTETVGFVLQVLSAKGGSVEKKALSNDLFKLVQKDPNRNKIMNLAFKDEFLSGSLGDVPFSFDGTTVSMG